MSKFLDCSKVSGERYTTLAATPSTTSRARPAPARYQCLGLVLGLSGISSNSISWASSVASCMCSAMIPRVQKCRVLTELKPKCAAQYSYDSRSRYQISPNIDPDWSRMIHISWMICAVKIHGIHLIIHRVFRGIPFFLSTLQGLSSLPREKFHWWISHCWWLVIGCSRHLVHHFRRPHCSVVSIPKSGVVAKLTLNPRNFHVCNRKILFQAHFLGPRNQPGSSPQAQEGHESCPCPWGGT